MMQGIVVVFADEDIIRSQSPAEKKGVGHGRAVGFDELSRLRAGVFAKAFTGAAGREQSRRKQQGGQSIRWGTEHGGLLGCNISLRAWSRKVDGIRGRIEYATYGSMQKMPPTEPVKYATCENTQSMRVRDHAKYARRGTGHIYGAAA